MKEKLYSRRSYADLLHSALTRYATRVAFIGEDRCFTYEASARATQRLRNTLRGMGIRKGSAVAILGGNRPESFFARAAALMEGARTTPMHPENSYDDHLYALDFADIDVLMYEPDRFDDLAELAAAKLPDLRLLPLTDMSSVILNPTEGGGLEEPVALEEDDISMIQFSGGTTGRPKGIIQLDRTMVTNTLYSMTEWEWPDNIKFLVTTPLSHATGAMVGPVLLQGGTAVMCEKFTPSGFVDLVEEHGINSTFLVPTMIYRLLDLEDLEDSRLKTLETVIYGASLIIPKRLEDAIKRFGQIFLQLYGQAEAPNLVTALKRAEHDPSIEGRLSTCGQPLSCAVVALLDEDDNEVAEGEVGEIAVRGPIVMGGYWKQEELTAEVFSSGWLHTGDLAKRGADGYLTIVGRKKDMVITGGLNVYPAEVESVLAEHPELSTAFVVGVPDPDWGERLVAFVVPAAGVSGDPLRASESPLAAELTEFVKARKGSVQTPKDFLQIGQIPVTNIGKPDKNELVRIAETVLTNKASL